MSGCKRKAFLILIIIYYHAHLKYKEHGREVRLRSALSTARAS